MYHTLGKHSRWLRKQTDLQKSRSTQIRKSEEAWLLAEVGHKYFCEHPSQLALLYDQDSVSAQLLLAMSMYWSLASSLMLPMSRPQLLSICTITEVSGMAQPEQCPRGNRKITNCLHHKCFPSIFPWHGYKEMSTLCTLTWGSLQKPKGFSALSSPFSASAVKLKQIP